MPLWLGWQVGRKRQQCEEQKITEEAPYLRKDILGVLERERAWRLRSFTAIVNICETCESAAGKLEVGYKSGKARAL